MPAKTLVKTVGGSLAEVRIGLECDRFPFFRSLDPSSTHSRVSLAKRFSDPRGNRLIVGNRGLGSC